jgi:hypothetical protein
MAKKLGFGGGCDRCGSQFEATGKTRIVPGDATFGASPPRMIREDQYACPNPKCDAPPQWVAVGDVGDQP